jgi:hypothetical protein
MSGGLLTMAAQLMCPHGGTIVPIPNSPRVTLGGTSAVYETDTFVIAGCPFNIAGAPSPCVRVQWQLPSQTGSGGGAKTLTADSVGFCFAGTGAIQGSVLIQSTQTPVTGS